MSSSEPSKCAYSPSISFIRSQFRSKPLPLLWLYLSSVSWTASEIERHPIHQGSNSLALAVQVALLSLALNQEVVHYAWTERRISVLLAKRSGTAPTVGFMAILLQSQIPPSMYYHQHLSIFDLSSLVHQASIYRCAARLTSDLSPLH